MTERSKQTPDDGGPAFPYNELNQQTGGVYAQHAGMSIRDWFAGQALAGLISHPSSEGPVINIAKWAYDYADAMIAARAQGGAA